MASNFEECPTGILIDFVEDTTASNSHSNKKEYEDRKAPRVESSSEKETSGCQTPLVNNLGNSCLGDELTKKDERDEWAGWRTPSPTTMNMISEEAFRIVDQLHTSLEISLWDEEFPVSSTLEDDCSEEYYESEVLSHNGTTNSLSCGVTVIKREILKENELTKKCLSTTKGDLSSIEKNFTKKNCSLRNSCVLTVNFNATETNSDVHKNSGNSVTTEGSSGSSEEKSDEAEGSSGTVEENFRAIKRSSGAVEEISLAAEGYSGVEKNSGPTKGILYKKISGMSYESSTTTKRRSSIKDHSFGPSETISNEREVNCDELKGNCDTLEGNPDTLEKGSVTLEGSSVTLEGSSVTLEGSSVTLEGSSVTLEESPGTLGESPSALGESPAALGESPAALGESPAALGESPAALGGSPGTPERSFEKNCNVNNKNSANEKCGATVKYANAFEEKSCIKTRTKKVCTVIKKSYVAFEENSLTQENSAVTKEIKTVKVVNSSMIVKNSNGEDSIDAKDMEHGHLSSESIINEKNIISTPSTSLNIKSRLSKAFKGSALKTPINHSKEKENVFQANKDRNALSEKGTSKIGQFSSVKSILGEANVNGSEILKSKSNIKTPLSKRMFGKIPFARGENKLNMNMSQDQTKETIKQSNVPLKTVNSLQFTPASSIKTPLRKSNSVMDTPNLLKPVRRSNSFQTRPSIENSIQMKRQKSFVAVSHLKTLNSKMSLHQTGRVGSELKTPSKGSFLPKQASNTFATPFSANTKSCARASQIACPSFGSALKQINTPIPGSKQVVGFKRPVSTTSKTRFASRLELPSPLPKEINDNIPRRLFPDNTPKKRFN